MKNINEQINRIKSLFTEERLFGNLVEQTTKNIKGELENLNHNIPVFLDDVSSSDDTTPKIKKDSKTNIILYYEYTPIDKESKTKYPGSGTLSIYRVVSNGGIPFVVLLNRFINNFGVEWRRSPKGLLPSDVNELISEITKINDPAERLISVWEKPLDYSISKNGQDMVKHGAIDLISENYSQFKKSYQQITRSENNLKKWWGPTPEYSKPFTQDNPLKIENSNYYISVVNKIKKYPNAQQVLKIINDSELIFFIKYKVDKHKSDGEYNELLKNTPQPV